MSPRNSTTSRPPQIPPQRKTLLCLLRIMPPVLQTARALAVRILLGLALLRQMPLAVGHHLAHVIDVVLIVGLGVLVRVLLEDFDNLSPASFYRRIPSCQVFCLLWCFVSCSFLPLVANRLSGAVLLAPARALGRLFLQPGFKV